LGFLAGVAIAIESFFGLVNSKLVSWFLVPPKSSCEIAQNIRYFDLSGLVSQSKQLFILARFTTIGGYKI
jgi:hypothetical protein